MESSAATTTTATAAAAAIKIDISHLRDVEDIKEIGDGEEEQDQHEGNDEDGNEVQVDDDEHDDEEEYNKDPKQENEAVKAEQKGVHCELLANLKGVVKCLQDMTKNMETEDSKKVEGVMETFRTTLPETINALTSIDKDCPTIMPPNYYEAELKPLFDQLNTLFPKFVSQLTTFTNDKKKPVESQIQELNMKLQNTKDLVTTTTSTDPNDIDSVTNQTNKKPKVNDGVEYENEILRKQLQLATYKEQLTAYEKQLTAYEKQLTAYEKKINDGIRAFSKGSLFLAWDDVLVYVKANEGKIDKTDLLSNFYRSEFCKSDQTTESEIDDSTKAELLAVFYRSKFCQPFYKTTFTEASAEDKGNVDVITADGKNSKGGSRSISSKQANGIDIFGNIVDTNSKSAHLMPNAHDCATLWFSIVPFVLANVKINGTTNYADILKQKTDMDTNILKQEAVEDADILQQKTAKEVEKEWDMLQKCIHGSYRLCRDKKYRRVPNTGIKHYQPNQIRLQNQKWYDSENPRFLIIPILTVDEVKNWDGFGYSAIVLARGDEGYPSHLVYHEIGATGVPVEHTCFLATVEELETATSLLKTFLQTYHLNVKQNKKFFRHLNDNKICKDWKAVCENSIDLPELKKKIKHYGNGYVAVPKVTFGRYTYQKNQKKSKVPVQVTAVYPHPAPEPNVLLGKAGSNITKRNRQNIFPACDEKDDDNEETDNEDDYDEDYDSTDNSSLPKEISFIGTTADMENVTTGSKVDSTAEKACMIHTSETADTDDDGSF